MGQDGPSNGLVDSYDFFVVHITSRALLSPAHFYFDCQK